MVENGTEYDYLIASTSFLEICEIAEYASVKSPTPLIHMSEDLDKRISGKRMWRHNESTKKRTQKRRQQWPTSGHWTAKNFLHIIYIVIVIAAIADGRTLAQQLTPVVGGKCKLSTPDVHIGGKQTQFFLKCEPSADSPNSDEGVWIVKSRQMKGTSARISAAAVASAAASETKPNSTTAAVPPMHSHPKKASPSKIHATDNYFLEITPAQRLGCVEDGTTRIGAPCALQDICLHAQYGNPEEYLQCDPVDHYWTKRHCEKGYTFGFAQQSCSLTTKDATFRQFPIGTESLSCSYTQCSPMAPCSVGTCNNGYCCSLAALFTPSSAGYAGLPLNTSVMIVSDGAFPALAMKDFTTLSTLMAFSDPAAHAPPRKRGLEEILRETTNNRGVCSSGFTSPVRCNAISERLSGGHTCPPGLFCDVSANLCCPLLLALPSPSDTARQLPSSTDSMSRFNTPRMRANNAANVGFHVGSVRRPPDHVATAMMMPARPNGGYQNGYRGMGSSQNGLRHTGGGGFTVHGNYGNANGFGDMPYNVQSNGDIDSMTVSGVRCYRRRGDSNVDLYPRRPPSAPVFFGGDENMNVGYGASLQKTAGARIRKSACPGGQLPFGLCDGGVCASNYQCIQPTNLCCPPLAPPPLPAAAPPFYPPPPTVALSQPAYCPGGGLSGGACVSGRCAPGYACSPPNNVCCTQMTQAIPATVCPDGTQAAGACVNNQCGAGFICNQGLCCASSSQTPRCLDGSQAIGACIQGNCGTGYSCTTGNICCPSTLNTCPNGQVSLGSCVNGQCPIGYTCINNQCCGTQAGGISCPAEDSRGPCGPDNTCAEPGVECDIAQQHCCPRTQGDPVGPCIQGEEGTRLCPDGYACTGPGTGQCYRMETNTCPPEEQFGPCASTDPQCPPGYRCIGDFCCSETGSTINRRRAKRRIPFFIQWM